MDQNLGVRPWIAASQALLAMTEIGAEAVALTNPIVIIAARVILP